VEQKFGEMEKIGMNEVLKNAHCSGGTVFSEKTIAKGVGSENRMKIQKGKKKRFSLPRGKGNEEFLQKGESLRCPRKKKVFSFGGDGPCKIGTY